MNCSRIYNNIITKAKELKDIRNNSQEYYEKHHIIPRSLGGKNECNNIVLLTPKEHFICHLLLWKVYPLGTIERTKMAFAFNQMRRIKNVKVSSKLYNILKNEHSNNVSVQKRGNQYAKGLCVRITNPITQHNKRIRVEDTIPDGYVKYKVPYTKKMFYYDPETDKEYRFTLNDKVPDNLVPGRSLSFRQKVSAKSLGNKSNKDNKLIHNKSANIQTFVDINADIPAGWEIGSLPREHKQLLYKGGYGRQVSISGVIYPSILAASLSLNVSLQTVVNRIKHPKNLYPDWLFIS